MVFKQSDAEVRWSQTVRRPRPDLIAHGHLEDGDRSQRKDDLVEKMGVSRTVLASLGRLRPIGSFTIQRDAACS